MACPPIAVSVQWLVRSFRRSRSPFELWFHLAAFDYRDVAVAVGSFLALEGTADWAVVVVPASPAYLQIEVEPLVAFSTAADAVASA